LSSTTNFSDQTFPPHLKLKKLAQAQSRLSGTIKLDHFDRLKLHALVDEATFAQENELDLNLSFDYDDSGWLKVQGSVNGELSLVCQRCLEPMRWPITLDVSLAVVSDDEDMADLPEIYEPIMLEDESITTVDLVEDDLLLSVPLVPTHVAGEVCEVSKIPGVELRIASEETPQPTKSPFSVLESLKGVGQSDPE